MILEKPDSKPGLDGAPHVPRRPRQRWWRRRWILVALPGLLVLAVLGVVLTNQRAAQPAATPTPVSAALIAHGQIVPARVAHVGTQAGGVVQQLGVHAGQDVSAQTPIAWVIGPSNALEIVTAPFSGSVSNVLVHEGDTLLPGAAIAIIADMRTLQIETTDVDEFLIGHVHAGQQVSVSIDALDNATATGTVSSVALLPEAGTAGGAQQYPVIVRMNGLPPDARPGMSVRITLPD